MLMELELLLKVGFHRKYYPLEIVIVNKERINGAPRS